MSEKKYFPLFVDLSEKKALVAGAGTVGRRRAGMLAKFGARVTVFDPFSDAPLLRGNNETGTIDFRKKSLCVEDLEDADLVVAASSDSNVNDQIVHLCRERGIPVNHAGDRRQCDFFFPAVAETDGLVIGISSSGQNHQAVRHFAERLREWLRGWE